MWCYRVVLCLHFRACLTGGPGTGASLNGPGVKPEVLTLPRRRRVSCPPAKQQGEPGGSGRRQPNAPPGCFGKGCNVATSTSPRLTSQAPSISNSS